MVPSGRTRGNGLREHQETLFHYEGDRALAQVAQRDCGVSIIGYIQKKPSGHSPGQAALGVPA